MPRYETDCLRIERRIDDLFQRDNQYMVGFYAGAIHGQKWMDALRKGEPLPPEPRSVYKRLQKHYEKVLKRMK